MAPPLGQDLEDRRARHLDRAHRGDAERTSLLLLRDHRVVLQGDLRVEPVGEHPLMVGHEFGLDADVPQAEAGEFGEVTVVLRVQTRTHDIDQPNGALFAGPRLEDLLLGGADRAPFELVLHDLEALIDLVLLDARAVPAQQKLDDVGGDGILAGVAPHQVLSHEVAGEGLVGLAVQGVHPEFRRIHIFSPLRVGCWARTRPSASVTTTTSAASSCSSSARTRLARPSASIGLDEEATDLPAGLSRRRSAVSRRHPGPGR